MAKLVLVPHDPLSNQMESQLMEREERQQREVDRFWGQDKDFSDRQIELQLMRAQEVLSVENERRFQLVALHERWDAEWEERLHARELRKDREKDVERVQYLNVLDEGAASSHDLINYVWKSRKALTKGSALGASVVGGEASMITTTKEFESIVDSSVSDNFLRSGKFASRSRGAPKHRLGVEGNGQAGGGGGRDLAVNMSVHLDGLQQTRAIVSEASFAFKQTLRRLNASNSFADRAMQTFQEPTARRGSLRKLDKLNASSSRKKHELDDKGDALNSLRIVEELQRQESESKRHVEALDGHKEYKWDQELMLRAVFSRLDADKKGFITSSDLLALSQNAFDVFSLLRFTVFWTLVKRKRWDFFLQCIERSPHRAAERALEIDAGVDEGFPVQMSVPVLTAEQWIAEAADISHETRVPLRHIRTLAEHTEHNRSTGSNSALFGTRLEREAYLSRYLSVGYSVWALHQQGVLWLPAVIESIYPAAAAAANASSSSEECEFFCDLWYPLNNRDLQRSRTVAESRQLLTLPSEQERMRGSLASNRPPLGSQDPSLLLEASTLQREGYYNDGRATQIPVKPLRGELEVCAYAFDLVDESGKGIVSLRHLIGSLHSAPFQHIVSTSVALRSIFYASASSGEPKVGGSVDRLPSLLPVFVDTFSVVTIGASEPEDGGLAQVHGLCSDTENIIGRNDFLEFCRVALDIKRYCCVM